MKIEKIYRTDTAQLFKNLVKINSNYQWITDEEFKKLTKKVK